SVAVVPPFTVTAPAVGFEAGTLILDELDPVGLQTPGPRGADLLRIPLANGDPRERRPADERVRPVDDGDPGPGSQEPAGRACGFQPSEAAAQDEKARRSHPSRYCAASRCPYALVLLRHDGRCPRIGLRAGGSS